MQITNVMQHINRMKEKIIISIAAKGKWHNSNLSMIKTLNKLGVEDRTLHGELRIWKDYN